MSEIINHTAETLTLEDVLKQRDAFLAAAKAINELFNTGPEAALQAQGRMNLTWKVPEGYHLEVSHADGKPRFADIRSVRPSDHGNSTYQSEEAFDPKNPLIVHEICAYPSSSDSTQYDLTGRPEGATYQAFMVYSQSFDEMNIQPVPDTIT